MLTVSIILLVGFLGLTEFVLGIISGISGKPNWMIALLAIAVYALAIGLAPTAEIMVAVILLFSITFFLPFHLIRK